MVTRRDPPSPISLIPGAPTSRPNNARALGDVGPGHPGNAAAAQAANMLSDALQSEDPATQTVAAAASVARVRNCRVVSALFASPAKSGLGANTLYGFRQQILPQNNERKLMVISTPWSHGNPPTPNIVYGFPGGGGINYAILFQPGPTNLTAIGSVNELNGYLSQAWIPLQNGGAYGQQNFDLPPTNPVTLIMWQWFVNAGGYGLDMNAAVIEGI